MPRKKPKPPAADLKRTPEEWRNMLNARNKERTESVRQSIDLADQRNRLESNNAALGSNITELTRKLKVVTEERDRLKGELDWTVQQQFCSEQTAMNYGARIKGLKAQVAALQGTNRSLRQIITDAMGKGST